MQKQTGKKKLLILALTAVILVAAAVILWLVFSQKKEDPGRQRQDLVVSDERKSGTKNWRTLPAASRGSKFPDTGRSRWPAGRLTGISPF